MGIYNYDDNFYGPNVNVEEDYFILENKQINNLKTLKQIEIDAVMIAKKFSEFKN